jgi:hypothetical protein
VTPAERSPAAVGRQKVDQLQFLQTLTMDRQYQLFVAAAYKFSVGVLLAVIPELCINNISRTGPYQLPVRCSGSLGIILTNTCRNSFTPDLDGQH